jgi:cytochrome c oxidase assembly factor 3
MSPGLKRARDPYRVRNAITGLILASFGVGVWAYSISAVKQDVFDDVDEEARTLARVVSVEEEKKAVVDSAVAEVKRGLLVDRFPRLLDPTGKTLVWGAPAVDKVGRMSDVDEPVSLV